MKRISMTYDEYQKDINQAESTGWHAGIELIVDILLNEDGNRISVGGFIERDWPRLSANLRDKLVKVSERFERIPQKV